MSDIPSMDRLAELQQLIADFSKITRAMNLADTGRRENDVEHSFGLALTCWFLAPKIAPELDLSKILRYALAHDIIELHSGDTFVFDEVAVASKPEREAAALRKLEQEWPDFTELTTAAKQYAEKHDAEAKFVYTIDKLLPPILVSLGEGDAFWERNKITRAMHEAEKHKKMRSSPEALPYLELLEDWLAKRHTFYEEPDNA